MLFLAICHIALNFLRFSKSSAKISPTKTEITNFMWTITLRFNHLLLPSSSRCRLLLQIIYLPIIAYIAFCINCQYLRCFSFAVIASECASCPELKCERPGCNASFCYHCKAEWHPNQTCDAARAQRSPNIRSNSISYSQDSQHSKLDARKRLLRRL